MVWRRCRGIFLHYSLFKQTREIFGSSFFVSSEGHSVVIVYAMASPKSLPIVQAQRDIKDKNN